VNIGKGRGAHLSKIAKGGAAFLGLVRGWASPPEHVHLISEPERGKLSLVIQMLKQLTSRKLKPADRSSRRQRRSPEQAKRVEGAGQLERFWQVRYYDFPVWTEAKRIDKLRYIHRNPVDMDWPNVPRTGSGATSRTMPLAPRERWKSNRSGPHGNGNGRGVASRFPKAHPPRTNRGKSLP
jgi:REP element-mobilizing transposase RayT